MKAMRLVVPSNAQYAIQQLGNAAGVCFDDRQIVDVPLRTNAQLDAAKFLEKSFAEEGLSTSLRNGANAVNVYSVNVIDV
jgi:hypothetical protein